MVNAIGPWVEVVFEVENHVVDVRIGAYGAQYRVDGVVAEVFREGFGGKKGVLIDNVMPEKERAAVRKFILSHVGERSGGALAVGGAA